MVEANPNVFSTVTMQVLLCHLKIAMKIVFIIYTGWPKSNVPKVRAYCSASDRLIRKIFSGVCRDIHWFEEYLKIIQIHDHFCE